MKKLKRKKVQAKNACIFCVNQVKYIYSDKFCLTDSK